MASPSSAAAVSVIFGWTGHSRRRSFRPRERPSAACGIGARERSDGVFGKQAGGARRLAGVWQGAASRWCDQQPAGESPTPRAARRGNTPTAARSPGQSSAVSGQTVGRSPRGSSTRTVAGRGPSRRPSVNGVAANHRPDRSCSQTSARHPAESNGQADMNRGHGRGHGDRPHMTTAAATSVRPRPAMNTTLSRIRTNT